MEGLGVAASVIAVVELSAKIASLCFQYSKDVKHAKDDIDRLRREVSNLENVSRSAQQLLDGPSGTKLKVSQHLLVAIKDAQLQLQTLHYSLRPKTRQMMGWLSIRSLKWPFQSTEVEKVVQGLGRCTQMIGFALQVDQTTILLDIDQKTVLDRLPVAIGASFDSQAEQHNPTCLPNTRVELLQQILDWSDDPRAEAIFWLNGMAGTGKSTISRTIAQSFDRNNQLGASFFFKRGEADRGNLSKFFTTIAADLVVREPAVARYVKDVIDTDPAIIRKAAPEQFDKLILQPLSMMPPEASNNPSIIIVDALDECERDEDIKLMINLFSRARSLLSQRVRIFLTSRPELPVRLGFKAIGGRYQDLVLHEIPEPIVEHDITVFLQQELAKIRLEYNISVSEERQLPTGWPAQSDVQSLLKMAVPLFIFAATICRFLADRKCSNPEKQLRKVLKYQTKSQESKLDATYLPVLDQQIAGLSIREAEGVLQEFRHIVGSIVILARPLSTNSLARMLNVDKDDVDNRLDSLHSILSIPLLPTLPVRLLHLSFRDFLVDPEKRGKNPFWVDEKQAHAEMSANCLRIMASLKADLCDSQNPSTPRAAIEPEKIEACLPPDLQYACLYWVHHMQQAGIPLADGDQVHKFLTNHFLHWMEVLSLIDKASESFGILKILQSLLKPGCSAQVSGFLNDAVRFVSTNIYTIDSTPLQLYSSSLVFSPEKSKVRAIFHHEIPHWVSLKPKVASDWSQCLQTLEGHCDWVKSVAFSHDSVLIASASSDLTVRLWDTNTGECVQTLKGHSQQVDSVAFSHDSALIASGSYDKTVRLWRTDIGECIQVLEGHSREIYSVAFSHDSALIASGSIDTTVRLWCTNTGECVQILKGQGGSVHSVVFSHNSALIASASDDMIIRLWRADTGECVQIFEGHSQVVYSVAFSHDSTLIVSGSGDKIARLWRTDTGECVQTLEGHCDWIRSVAFSHDSALIASASEKTVQLWRTNTGECVVTFKGHTQWVSSVTFSHDSAYIASASGDMTVRLWHINTDKYVQQTFEGHSEQVNSVAFSHDSALIASASDKTVRLWRADTGECVQIFESYIYNSLMRSVTFSHDSALIASGSINTTVQLWRVDTGECILMFNGSNGPINSVAFSHDSALIALASWGKTVELWHANIAGGECVKTFEGHSDSINSVAFSHDSALLASASRDKTVRLWRTNTGECVYNINIGVASSRISFEPGNLRLLTDVGTIAIHDMVPVYPSIYSPTEVIRSDCFGYGVSSDNCWVTWNKGNLLRLPVDFQASCSATSGSTVVVGCSSGRVIVIRFSSNELPEGLQGV